MAFSTQQITTSGGASGNLVLVETKEFTAVDEIEFTGLDSDSDGTYMIVGYIDNLYSGNLDMTLQINGNATATNYYYQVLFVGGTTVSAGEYNNNAGILFIPQNGRAVIEALLHHTQEMSIYSGKCDNGKWGASAGYREGSIKYNSGTKISSFSYHCSGSNMTGKLSLYKITRS